MEGERANELFAFLRDGVIAPLKHLNNDTYHTSYYWRYSSQCILNDLLLSLEEMRR